MKEEYLGKICPFCKTEFKEGDEIVVCSSCDMPHHKECWTENQGCTTFGCLGTVKSADGEQNSVTASEMKYEEAAPVSDPVYCAKCGTLSASGAVFCIKCGSPLPVAASADKPNIAQSPDGKKEPFLNIQQNPVLETPPQKPIYCTRCGTPSSPDTAFCTKCGNPLSKPGTSMYNSPYMNAASGNTYAPNVQQAYSNMYAQQGTYTAGGTYIPYGQNGVDPEMVTYIGIKSEYYIPKFNEMKTLCKQTSWNWCAFLVAPYWFIYRKMYAYGAAILGISFLFSIVGGLMSLFSLAGYITLGIFGNFIYIKWIEKLVAQGRTVQEPFKSQFIMKNRGVNATAVVLTIAGYFILNLFIGLLFW